MNKTIIIIISVICLFVLLSVNVFAEEVIVEEPVAEEVQTEEIVTENEDIYEKINDNLTQIKFILLFTVFVYFSEKWLNIAMTMMNKGGKVHE